MAPGGDGVDEALDRDGARVVLVVGPVVLLLAVALVQVGPPAPDVEQLGDQLRLHRVDRVRGVGGELLREVLEQAVEQDLLLGGQVALAGELLIAPLQARVDDLCLPVVGQSVRIVQSKHGSEANIVGAVTLALQDV